MKKKILVEDIERMVREEVSKRLSEQEEGLLPKARLVIFNAVYDIPKYYMNELGYAGVDADQFRQRIKALTFDKWAEDIKAAALASKTTPRVIGQDD